MQCSTNLASHPTNNLRFYAKLAELRQRIRANSMPVLNKELEEDPASRPARKSMSEVPSVNNMLSQSASLPRQPELLAFPLLSSRNSCSWSFENLRCLQESTLREI